MGNEIDVMDAFSRLSRIASQREICTSDAETRLRSWGLDDEEKIGKIITDLQSGKFIDNSRYTRAFVNDKFKYNGWGRIKLRAHLRQKKIDDDIVNDALEALDEELYYARAYKIASTYLKTAKAKNKFELKGKLLRHLASKGFETDLAFRLFESLSGLSED